MGYMYDFDRKSVDYRNIPEGDYLLTLVDVSEGTNTSGKKYMKLSLLIDDYDAELSHVIYLTPKSRPFLANLLVSLGIEPVGKIDIIAAVKEHIGEKLIGKLKRMDKFGKEWLTVESFERYIEPIIEVDEPDEEVPF